MKVTRHNLWDLFDANWCISCGRVTNMTPSYMIFPGIFRKQCCDCANIYIVNHLENSWDLLDIPDSSILPKDKR